MSGLQLLWQGAAVLVGGGLLGLVYKGFDRKLAARMQARIGPPCASRSSTSGSSS